MRHAQWTAIIALPDITEWYGVSLGGFPGSKRNRGSKIGTGTAVPLFLGTVEPSWTALTSKEPVPNSGTDAHFASTKSSNGLAPTMDKFCDVVCTL